MKALILPWAEGTCGHSLGEASKMGVSRRAEGSCARDEGESRARFHQTHLLLDVPGSGIGGWPTEAQEVIPRLPGLPLYCSFWILSISNLLLAFPVEQLLPK